MQEVLAGQMWFPMKGLQFGAERFAIHLVKEVKEMKALKRYTAREKQSDRLRALLNIF